MEEESDAFIANADDKKIWVFAQFNVPDEKGMDSYYYYGKVSKSLFEKISNNKTRKGFLLLEKIRYWGTDDIIYEYRDKENSGDIMFRIEDIRRMVLVHKEPTIGMGYEQYKEHSKTEKDTETSPEAETAKTFTPREAQ